MEGNDISQMNPVELRRNIGYVIQQIGLFPHMTIEDNISVVPRLKRREKEKSYWKDRETATVDRFGFHCSVTVILTN